MRSAIITLISTTILSTGLLACTQGSQTEAPSNDTTSTNTNTKTEAEAVKTANNAISDAALAEMLQAAPAGVYKLDKYHGYITFSYLHMGFSKPSVRWDNWDSQINWDPANPTNSSVEATIHTDSIDSGIPTFDEHLKSADFFDVANYPAITFKSTAVTQEGNRGTITGDLTIKGVTKPITLNVVFNKAGDGYGGSKALGFSANGKLQRSDYGLGAYTPDVSNRVSISIEAEYQLKSAQ